MILDKSLYFTKEDVKNFLQEQNIGLQNIRTEYLNNLDMVFDIARYFLVSTNDGYLAVAEFNVYNLVNKDDLSSANINKRLSKAWRAHVHLKLAKIDEDLTDEGFNSDYLAAQYKNKFEHLKQERIKDAEEKLDDIKKDEF